MALKLHPTTIRLSEDDQTFLASLSIPGASTISDKLRVMIEDRRLQQQAGRDYKSALMLANSMIGPLQNCVKLAENEHRMHSQLLRRVLDWMPEFLAVVIAEGVTDAKNLPDKTELEGLEDAVVIHLVRLMDVLLQSYIARATALYRADSLNAERLVPLQKLYRLIEDDTNDKPQ